jgi:hypothetical protein
VHALGLGTPNGVVRTGDEQGLYRQISPQLESDR